MNLTIKSVKALKPDGRDKIFFDDDLPRFGVRVRPSGVKSYVIQYRNQAGKTRKKTIGGAEGSGAWTLPEARERAKELLRDVDSGSDPVEVDEENQKAKTVGELCEEYFRKARQGLILKKGGGKKKESTLTIDEGRVRQHVQPILGEAKARDVTSNDIRQLIEKITLGETRKVEKGHKPRARIVVRGGEGAARRTVAMLSAIFAWGVKVGYCAINPCVGVDRTRDNKKRIHLTREQYRELAEKLNRLRPAQPTFCAIAELIALTGLRRNEAVKLKTREVDFFNRCIRLEDSKTGKSMRPLGEAAIALLQQTIVAGRECVFPSVGNAGKPFTTFAKDWARHIGTDLTPHGLRHGFAGTAFALGYDTLTVKYLLGHSVTSDVTEGYIVAPPEMILRAANRVSAYVASAMRGDTATVFPLDRRGAADSIDQASARC